MILCSDEDVLLGKLTAEALKGRFIAKNVFFIKKFSKLQKCAKDEKAASNVSPIDLS